MHHDVEAYLAGKPAPAVARFRQFPAGMDGTDGRGPSGAVPGVQDE